MSMYIYIRIYIYIYIHTQQIQLNTFSINHSYEITENAIFIKQQLTALDKEETSKPIGWIFRRNLDYVSLDYINGDWSRKFLWSCEITTSEQLKIRIKNKLNELIKVNGKNFNLSIPASYRLIQHPH